MLGVKPAFSSILFNSQVLKSTITFGSRGTYSLFSTEKTYASSDTVDPTSSDLIDPELKLDFSEEELERKRLKHGLSDLSYRTHIKKELIPLEHKEHFKKKYLRKTYGKLGEQSGLNPGICWPTRDELQEIIEHDKMFYPSLREMLDNIAAAEQQKMQERLEYEAEVEQNLKKLEVYKKEYYAKIAKQKAAAEAAKLKQQQLIEEISELLGYDVDPKDPKFQEAVEMKKKEEKKVKKEKKQKESYEKLLAKLAGMAATRKKEEATIGGQTEAEDTAKAGQSASECGSEETSPTSK